MAAYQRYQYRIRHPIEELLVDDLCCAHSHMLWESTETVGKGVYCENIPVRRNGQWNDELVWILNPPEYAGDYHRKFINLSPKDVKIVFIGKDPTLQSVTGIPFFQEQQLCELIGKPPISQEFLTWMGPRADVNSVSGERFWKLNLDNFFNYSEELLECAAIINFCPLIFLNEDRTATISLENLDCQYHPLVSGLLDACEQELCNIFTSLQPELVVAVGGYADDRVQSALAVEYVRNFAPNVETVAIQHPAHPSYCKNYPRGLPLDVRVQGWEDKARRTLLQNEIFMSVTTKPQPYERGVLYDVNNYHSPTWK